MSVAQSIFFVALATSIGNKNTYDEGKFLSAMTENDSKLPSDVSTPPVVTKDAESAPKKETPFMKFKKVAFTKMQIFGKSHLIVKLNLLPSFGRRTSR